VALSARRVALRLGRRRRWVHCWFD
jgi:hypothetical protein